MRLHVMEYRAWGTQLLVKSSPKAAELPPLAVVVVKPDGGMSPVLSLPRSVWWRRVSSTLCSLCRFRYVHCVCVCVCVCV